MSQSVSVNFSNPISSDRIWIRLEQIVDKPTSTVSEIAELFDNFFDVSPCSGESDGTTATELSEVQGALVEKG